ncbi:hypothetical protein COLO4_23508 [Corchorus olitorius]|uniref:F-box domain-containing protein n=1 Tax=Corchorus olitorius TaxID=93759 RepID=A0A1R3IG79_9ROSI|nr:hypothetical protein COLO4_23508 [Corchorus olitorius]
MNYLHEDLLAQILVKLPPKSIVRFHSVSKTWCSLFTDHNKKKNNCLLIVKSHDEHKYEPRMCLFHDVTGISYQDFFPQIPPSIETSPSNICVHDGWLCLLHNSDRDISLWNPATGQLQLLPNCHQNIDFHSTKVCHQFIGFGSDHSSSSEYKVIQCFYYSKYSTDGPPHHLVYSTSTNSWKRVEPPVKGYGHTSRSNGCVNGVHYWVGYSSILAFHFSTQVYQVIDIPKEIDTRQIATGKKKLLRLSGDRICLWIPNRRVDDQDNDDNVWLLNNDDKGQYFWTEQSRTDDHFPQLEKMQIRVLKDNVFVKVRKCPVLLCELETKKFQDLEIEVEKDWHISGVYTFQGNNLFPFTYTQTN